MALSGSVTTPSSEGRSVTLNWSATQSIANNSSTISWKLVGSGSFTGYVVVSEIRIKIDGSEVYYRSSSNHTDCYKDTELCSGSITLSHNNDGAKSFSISVEAGIYQWAINCSKSESFTLDTIPRASFISVPTLTLGTEGTITVTKASSSFTHTIEYVWGKETGTICTKSSSASIAWTPSLNLAKSIPSTTSGVGTLKCTTYNGNTNVGSKSIQFTCNVPSSMIPTVDSMSLSIVNENEIINEWGLCVKGYSKVQVDCDASGTHGSTISNYTISGGYSATVNSLPYTGDILKSSGDISFACVVKDSRGRKSSSASSTVKVYDYSSPTISKFNVERSAEDSTKMIASVAYSFTLVDTQNYAEATLYYKESASNSWTTYGIIDNDAQLTLDVEFEEIKSYDFRVIVKDALGNADREETLVSTIKVLMDLRAGGKGLGIGKICESDSFEIGFEANFYEDAHFAKNIFASNLGLEEHTGMDNCLKDTGLIDTEVNSGCRIYILKPFNLAFIRLYIGGFASNIDAKTDGYTTICSVSDDLKPEFSAALTGCAVKDFSVLIKDTGDIQIVPRSGFSTSNVMYISGIYNLSAESPYYI